MQSGRAGFHQFADGLGNPRLLRPQRRRVLRGFDQAGQDQQHHHRIGSGIVDLQTTRRCHQKRIGYFLKRYDDNAVQPATTNLFASDTDLAITTTLGDLGPGALLTIPAGHTGVIEIGYAAESACYGGTSGWCRITLLSNGSAVGHNDFAFASNDGAPEGAGSFEGHAMTRVFDDLPAGTYVITASSSIGFRMSTFRLDDMVLTTDIHLTS